MPKGSIRCLLRFINGYNSLCGRPFSLQLRFRNDGKNDKHLLIQSTFQLAHRKRRHKQHLHDNPRGNRLDYDVAVTRVYINNEPRDLLFNTGDGVKIPKAASGPVYVTGSYTAGAMYDVKVVFDSGQSLITVVRY